MTRSISLRAEVRAALDARTAASGPALVYDLAAIDACMASVAACGRRHDVRVLFSMKSFAHARVLARAAELLDGLDAGGPIEGHAAFASRARTISITDASATPIEAAPGRDLRISCEDPARARACAGLDGARLAVRISASFLVPGDDAAPGVLEGNASRFGARSIDDARAIVRAGGGRVRGLHVHYGGIAPASPARLVACARAALAVADAIELPVDWIDLGGGLHLLPDLDAAFAAVRAEVPRAIEIVVEPGRLFSQRAGVAIGHVRRGRDLDDGVLRVVTLSRICHLKWQQLTPVAPPAATGAARKIVFAGATCHEQDVVGEWKLDPERFACGAPLIVAGVDGYALGWNHGFGGIAPAEVVLIE